MVVGDLQIGDEKVTVAESPGGWLLLLFFILLKIGGGNFFLQNLKFVGDLVNDLFLLSVGCVFMYQDGLLEEYLYTL